MPRSVLNAGATVCPAAATTPHDHDVPPHTHGGGGGEEATRLAAGSYLKIEHGGDAWRLWLEPETTNLHVQEFGPVRGDFVSRVVVL